MMTLDGAVSMILEASRLLDGCLSGVACLAFLYNEKLECGGGKPKRHNPV